MRTTERACFRSKSGNTYNISVLSVDHYVLQGLKLCLKIAVIQIKITPLGNNLELTIYFTLYVPNSLAFGTEINDLVPRLIINSQLTDN